MRFFFFKSCVSPARFSSGRPVFIPPGLLGGEAWPPASFPSMRPQQQALPLLLLLALQGTVAVHEARHAAIMSTRGIQFKDPWVSDDFVVGCIMIMFLLLFCFGKQ